MLEWLKRHAWKACNRQNRFAGSNPVLSASFISVQLSPCRRRAVFFVFCILVVPHLRRGLWIMPSSQLAVPIGGFVFLFPRFFDENTTISPFHLFTFSPFHLFDFDENTTISPFHLFTFSILTKTPRFHLFTFSLFHRINFLKRCFRLYRPSAKQRAMSLLLSTVSKRRDC